MVLSRKGRRMAAKAEAKARKAAAQEAAEEAAVQAAVEAAHEAALLRSKERNNDPTPTCVDTISAVFPSIKTEPKTAEMPGQSPEDAEADCVQKPVVAKSMSRNAIRNRRKRASRRVKKAMQKAAAKEDGVEDTPRIAASTCSKPLVAPKDENKKDTVKQKENTSIPSHDREVTDDNNEDVDQPKWLRSTAYLFGVESWQNKTHEFYLGDQLDAHEKIHCVLNSIRNEYLSHDGCHRQVDLKHWRDWQKLSGPCKRLLETPQNDSATYIHELPCSPMDTGVVTLYQTKDTRNNYHTFTSEGVPLHAAQIFECYEKGCNQQCHTTQDFEALMIHHKMAIAQSSSIVFDSYGNPYAQSLSNLECGGVVYRGAPRCVRLHIMVVAGHNEKGEPIYVEQYTKRMLAYKSFYRVMSTEDRDTYHYGGEHLFYPSGYPSMHLCENLEPEFEANDKFIFV
ncbi:hypothetical protein M9435_002082 [Picochlorum sp. BPE23]|nr:hypothetical protein M9435_002082 [Picochlorum sp. BPE23]